MTVTITDNLLSGTTEEGYEIKTMILTDDEGFGGFISTLVLGDILIPVDDRAFQAKTLDTDGVITVVAAYENTSPLDEDYSQNPVKNFQISS